MRNRSQYSEVCRKSEGKWSPNPKFVRWKIWGKVVLQSKICAGTKSRTKQKKEILARGSKHLVQHFASTNLELKARFPPKMCPTNIGVRKKRT
jgi:hypothetical protein